MRSVLSEIHGEGSVFREADLTGASLQGARLIGSSFHRAVLTGANLIGAEINGWLSEADLRGADFRRADLAGSNFRDAKLEGANLRGTHLASTADLTWDQLHVACIDDTTTLPDYLIDADTSSNSDSGAP